jgi:hypothetical protein
MPGGVLKASSSAREVNRASFEVERARDATHSAVALRRAATAGDSDSRTDSQEAHEVAGGVISESPPFFGVVDGRWPLLVHHNVGHSSAPSSFILEQSSSVCFRRGSQKTASAGSPFSSMYLSWTKACITSLHLVQRRTSRISRCMLSSMMVA